MLVRCIRIDLQRDASDKVSAMHPLMCEQDGSGMLVPCIRIDLKRDASDKVSATHPISVMHLDLLQELWLPNVEGACNASANV